LFDGPKKNAGCKYIGKRGQAKHIKDVIEMHHACTDHIFLNNWFIA